MKGGLIPEGLLFELAPLVRINGHQAPCARLNGLLRGEAFNPRSSCEQRALIVCALGYQIASRVLEDLALGPRLPDPVRWKRKLQPRPLRIAGHHLFWGKPAAGHLGLLAKTRAYLRDLPDALIDSMLAWAPPVVLGLDNSGRHRVVANHISALLMHQCRADVQVTVRQTVHRTELCRSLAVMCQATRYVMEPLFLAHRQRIARIAGKLPDAQVLTGYGRSHAADLMGGPG